MFVKNLFLVIGIVLLGSFITIRMGEFMARRGLISPVLGVAKEKISENIWTPKIEKTTLNQFADAPEITSIAALFVDTKTGQILYEKNPRQELSIASLTKIMTTIVALENRNLSDTFSVSKQASEMEPDKMFLIAGEKMTLKELLDGIFLVSANDAAEVIAENTSGRREEFINLMNSKARQLGMDNTFFLNPSGLEEDNVKQYSSALDVAIMSRYLITHWPEIVNISSQPHVYIERTNYHQDYDMYSGINLLTTYPGVLGLKTGYTPEAGLTLVTLARRGDKEVIGVLLGAVNRRDDAKLMLDYSFKKLGLDI
jgi:serine-type D-Ala-D-Ala carboxypeptidase (penicillin-binding protein 5/6)